jgi:hypothetical protein
MRCALASSNEKVKTAGTTVSFSGVFCRSGGGGGMKASDVSGVAAAVWSEDFDDLFVRGVFLDVVSSSAAFRLVGLELISDAGVDGAERVADRVTGMINLSVDVSLDNASLMQTQRLI